MEKPSLTFGKDPLSALDRPTSAWHDLDLSWPLQRVGLGLFLFWM